MSPFYLYELLHFAHSVEEVLDLELGQVGHSSMLNFTTIDHFTSSIQTHETLSVGNGCSQPSQQMSKLFEQNQAKICPSTGILNWLSSSIILDEKENTIENVYLLWHDFGDPTAQFNFMLRALLSSMRRFRPRRGDQALAYFHAFHHVTPLTKSHFHRH